MNVWKQKNKELYDYDKDVDIKLKSKQTQREICFPRQWLKDLFAKCYQDHQIWTTLMDILRDLHREKNSSLWRLFELDDNMADKLKENEMLKQEWQISMKTIAKRTQDLIDFHVLYQVSWVIKENGNIEKNAKFKQEHKDAQNELNQLLWHHQEKQKNEQANLLADAKKCMRGIISSSKLTYFFPDIVWKN